MVRGVCALILAIMVIPFIFFLLSQTTGTLNKGVKVEFCVRRQLKKHMNVCGMSR